MVAVMDLAVYIFPMADFDDKYSQHLVLDLIDRPVVSDSDALERLGANQFS